MIQFAIMAAGIGMSLLASSQQAAAAKNQGRSELSASYYNAEMREYEAEIAKENAHYQAMKYLDEGKRIRSTQRAQFANSGVIVGEGSAMDIEQETQSLAERDAVVTMYNAVDENISAGAEARNMRSAGGNAYDAGQSRAKAAWISGVGSAVSQYQTYRALNTKR